MKEKIVRACTVSMSIVFVSGMLPDLMEKYEVVVLSSPGPEMEDVRRRYGVRTIAVPMERHISLRRDVAALWRLVKVFRKERPRMVHSMTPKAGLLCMVAAWLTRVPVRVHTFTGLVFPTAKGLQKRVLMLTDALTCACATHVIPEGEGVKNDLLTNGITRKPMKVLGYGNVKGIDLDIFKAPLNVPPAGGETRQVTSQKASPAEGGLEGAFTFLFVGRIVRDKGMNELMGAFQRLSSKNPKVRLVLVGRYEDSLDPISEEAREAIERNPAIEAVGPKYGDELLAYYAAADCFVFPSYREGFPNTVIEAGAMGLPCIVTDINGAREIISPSPALPRRSPSPALPRREGVVNGVEYRQNGMVIPPKDEEALYEAMWQMMTDTETREQMAANARPMIAARYEQGFVRKCLYNFYEEIL